jgi:hypothetical protein
LGGILAKEVEVVEDRKIGACKFLVFAVEDDAEGRIVSWANRTRLLVEVGVVRALGIKGDAE